MRHPYRLLLATVLAIPASTAGAQTYRSADSVRYNSAGSPSVPREGLRVTMIANPKKLRPYDEPPRRRRGGWW